MDSSHLPLHLKLIFFSFLLLHYEDEIHGQNCADTINGLFFPVDTHRLHSVENICSRLHAVDDLKC